MVRMSKKRVGTIFERKAYNWLKKKYELVTWLSINKNSPYDFKIRDVKTDKVWYGDAKLCNNGGYPFLRYSQRNADFIIIGDGDKIKMVWKRGFKRNKVRKEEEPFKNIKIRYNDFKKIQSLKIKLEKKRTYEVIKSLLEVVRRFKLAGELK